MELHELKELHIKTNEILDRVYEELTGISDLKQLHKETNEILDRTSQTLTEIQLKLKGDN